MNANFPWYDWAILGICLGLALCLIILVQRRPKEEEEPWLPVKVACDIEALVLQYGEDTVHITNSGFNYFVSLVFPRLQACDKSRHLSYRQDRHGECTSESDSR